MMFLNGKVRSSPSECFVLEKVLIGVFVASYSVCGGLDCVE